MELEKDSGAGEPDSPDAEDLEKKLEAEIKRNQELMTRLKYLQADMENYTKRMDKEIKEAGESSVRSLVTRLLVVLDELELAVNHAEAGESGELKEGVAMVEKNLTAALESAGLKRIACIGKPFDPELHEAAEKVQGRSRGDDVVIEELRPGFMFRGQLIRPSMVRVELAMREPTGKGEE